MKLWISRNCQVSVHEQLTTQIMLAIASGELKPHQKLPSTRGLTRSFDLHPNSSIAVISRWPDFLKWACAVLTAAGVDPATLSFRNACEDGWDRGLNRRTFVITDVVQAKRIPAKCKSLEFGLIAESSLEELRTYVNRFLRDT